MQLCWTLLSVVSALPQSRAELLKFELAALAPSLCRLPLSGVILLLGRDGYNVLLGVSDHHPATGARQSRGGGGSAALESKGLIMSLSWAALPKLRDCSQGKEDLHQQSKDERWFFASSKLPLCLKALSLMLGGHLTDLHISAIPEMTAC